MPSDATDARVQLRTAVLIKPEVVQNITAGTIVSRGVACTKEVQAAPVTADGMDELAALWAQARLEDPSYEELVDVVRRGERKFPATLGVKVSISECEVKDNELFFRAGGGSQT
jgi:hypothetical protein